MAALVTPFAGFAYLPHQDHGIRWMLERETDGAPHFRGGILADDMGLGKTWQAIGLLLNAPVPRTLLVLPPVLVAQWQQALDQARIHHATLGKGAWAGSADAAVFIVTYDRLWQNQAIVGAAPWDRIILDEGHYIRNGPSTRRYRGVAALAAERRWILSGTPVQNSKNDFVHLLAWLGLELPPNQRDFEHLQGFAEDVLLRRTMLELRDQLPPPPTHHQHDLPFTSAAEQRVFQVLVQRLEDAVERGCPPAMKLELYNRIRMFIAHPQIYIKSMRRKYGPQFGRGDWNITASKLTGFQQLLEADSTAPTLVFTQFRDEVGFLGRVAKRAGYRVIDIQGGLTQEERGRRITESRTRVERGEHVMLICQITTANCGLNLQHLNRVIFYTQHWNPAVIDQAMTRCYRFGQQSSVSVHHLLVGAREFLNMDRYMLNTHSNKRTVAQAIHPDLEFPFHPNLDAAATMEGDPGQVVETRVLDDDPAPEAVVE